LNQNKNALVPLRHFFLFSLQDEANKQWYEDEQDYSEDGVQPICSMLYQLSGKCNKHLSVSNQVYNNDYGDTWDQMYQSEQQAQNEDLVCGFIDMLNSGSFDENGQVYLNAGNWAQLWASPSNWGREFQLESNAMTVGRKVALSLLGLAVVSMAIYACYLHGALARKNIPWRPRRNKGDDPMDIARQNSGIVMGRSRSGPANAPLI
jgi:hypothetical protein